MSPGLFRHLFATLHPRQATPAQIEAARRQMRQQAISDAIAWKVDHLDGGVILDDVAEWDWELLLPDTG